MHLNHSVFLSKQACGLIIGKDINKCLRIIKYP